MPGPMLTGKVSGIPANLQRARSEHSPSGRARCSLEPFPDSQGRAIINAVYGFCQFSRRKLEGPSPTRTVRQGSSLALPATALTRDERLPAARRGTPGVEPCSSGVHVDAGHHHIVLANTVGTAITVKEVKVRTDTVAQD